MSDITLFRGKSAIIRFQSAPVDSGAQFRFVIKSGNEILLNKTTGISFVSLTATGEVQLLDADTADLPLGTVNLEMQAIYNPGENYVIVRGNALIEEPLT